jgi:hypothetical protein
MIKMDKKLSAMKQAVDPLYHLTQDMLKTIQNRTEELKNIKLILKNFVKSMVDDSNDMSAMQDDDDFSNPQNGPFKLGLRTSLFALYEYPSNVKSNKKDLLLE